MISEIFAPRQIIYRIRTVVHTFESTLYRNLEEILGD